MKLFLQIVLSIFLATSIVAPSVISLIDSDNKMELVLDQNEDDNQKENKEGEKESSDKDTFYHIWNNSLSSYSVSKSGNNTFYLEECYGPTLNIFLPPPELS
ncbi:hypothetical protein [Maribacter sp. HTCC2170]|uniref:hypothetical protein n=1 Tax=Maribacter sp. (strain HTCC2170 / KCCM 42371) TaxID=313603 RepID=UPI00006BD5A8|nr:hypothetical protein [Maribacter sp. HTCC2170]EAR02953.1 hypothetical protein FB2170_06680 [Maribacter sp. HTCC2170]